MLNILGADEADAEHLQPLFSAETRSQAVFTQAPPDWPDSTVCRLLLTYFQRLTVVTIKLSAKPNISLPPRSVSGKPQLPWRPNQGGQS